MATLQVQSNPTVINMEEPQKSSAKSSDPSIVDDFMYSSNVAQANIYIRMGFLRKVYGILSVQLLFTAVLSYYGFLNEYYEDFFKTNPWMLFVLMILSFVFLIGLHVKRTEVPLNFIFLGLFTVCEAVLVSCIVTVYEATTVIQAAFMTLAVTVGLTLYTLQSTRDFSKMGAGLLGLLMILIMATFLQIFLPSMWLDLGISIAGALVFSGFIIYDTHLLMHRLSPEEYITATVSLYLDIINLFLYILRILNAMKKN